jgi:GLPGLI family protein
MPARHLIIILALAALCGGASAQQKQGHVMRPKPRGVGKTTVVGQAQLEVEYALNARDLRNPDTYLDLHILRAGKQLSKHYSRFLERGDSLYDAYMKANPNAEGVPSTFYTIGREGQYWSEYQSTEIFTEQGQQTFYAWMPWAMERYNAYYTEPAAQQKWTLANERKTILGHECQKATCHWRGRDFVAWFAPDIPVRLGPWSFGGLPGLILKLYDTQRLYTWEAVSLRSGTFPITKRKYEGFHKDSRAHVYKLQVAANRDHLKAGGAVDRRTGQLKSNPHSYEPLEKE